MLFNSVQYFVFLPIVWAVFWSVPVGWRAHFLLLASYIFYASWSPAFAVMLFGLAVLNYLFGLWLERADANRRLILWGCIAFDLGVLGFFKYWNFFASSWTRLSQQLTASQSDPILVHVVLPLGISFFTFEFIHYLVDIYRGAMPVHNFSKFHVFVAFFPTQISGPIKRFQQFVPALSRLDRLDTALASEGLWLISLGLAKKIFLADKLSPIADAGFTAGSIAGHASSAEAWIATIAFSLQIYFDFSGYTDIARGSAQLLGVHIPVNFNAPYLATSPGDFWHRWHISLSTWLRDYVYIPLGGSRRGLRVMLGALLVTFLVGGLWHGAAWHFVVWGMFWGAVICLERVMTLVVTPKPAALGSIAGWLVTQCLVLVGWVIFRANTLGSAWELLRAMVRYQPGTETVTSTVVTNVMLVGMGLILLSYVGARGWRVLPPPWSRAVLGGMAAAVAFAYLLSSGPAIDQRFIYFQF